MQEQERQIQVTVEWGKNRRRLACPPGQKLFALLLERQEELAAGGILLPFSGNCGGRGNCGRCAVRFLEGAPLPGHADRLRFSPAQLREGFRLACTARLGQDCRLCLPAAKKAEESRLHAVAEDRTPFGERNAARSAGTDEAQAERGYVIAVDIGTTTVAMELAGRGSGRVLRTHTFPNPGRVYGADVISRVQAAVSGSQNAMRAALLAALEEGTARLLDGGKAQATAPSGMRREDRPADVCLVCAGNTAMGHVLTGEPMDGLAAAPFSAGDLSLRALSLAGHPAVLLPGVSAFVGGDIVAGLYACEMERSRALTLYLDLGTNGEMVLGKAGGFVAASAAAGGAFEAAAGGGAGGYGADRMAAVAALLREGALNREGLLTGDGAARTLSGGALPSGTLPGDTLPGGTLPGGTLPEGTIPGGMLPGAVRLTQKDIRDFQLAKAAVRCGIEALLEEYGALPEEVERVFLAGGFGYFLREEDALLTGLLPGAFAGKVRPVGNAALSGALRYGLEGTPQEIEALAASVRSLSLAERRDFGAHYLSLLNFPPE